MFERINNPDRIVGNDLVDHFNTVVNQLAVMAELIGNDQFSCRIQAALCNMGNGFALFGGTGGEE